MMTTQTSEDEGEELLQEVAEDGGHGGLHALDVVDEGGEQGAGGVLLKEGDGAAQHGVVEVVAQVGDHAEAGVVDQVGADVVADGLEDGGGDERVGDDRPGVVEVAGHEEVQVEHAMEAAEVDVEFEQVVGWGVGAEDAVEDGLDEEDADGGHGSDDGHEEHGEERVEGVGAQVDEEAKDSLQRITGEDAG